MWLIFIDYVFLLIDKWKTLFLVMPVASYAIASRH